MLSRENRSALDSRKNRGFLGSAGWQICCTMRSRVLRKERIMKPFQSRLGIAVVGLALLAGPALAGQRPTQDGGAGHGGADRAVDRGSGGGGGSHGGGSSATAGSSAGASTVSSAPSSTASSPSVGAADRSAPRYAEPQHRGGSSG